MSLWWFLGGDREQIHDPMGGSRSRPEVNQELAAPEADSVSDDLSRVDPKRAKCAESAADAQQAFAWLDQTQEPCKCVDLVEALPYSSYQVRKYGPLTF